MEESLSTSDRITIVIIEGAKACLARVLQLLKDKKLEIILDPSSPHPFTEDGVESAYKLYTSGGGRGGIVVEVTL